MPWYLYLALKQLFSSGQRRFFTSISVLSVTLGVALLIIVLSVMGGFSYKIRDMIVETQGDVQVRATGNIENPAAVEAALHRIPGVVATTSFAQGPVVLLLDQKPSTPMLQGVDVATVAAVTPLDHFIFGGKLDDLDDDSVILSARLAESIGASIGRQVDVFSPAILLSTSAGEVRLPKQLTVVGIFQIGHQQLDSSTVIVTLRTMQDLYDLNGAVHGINIKVQDGLDADVAAARINAVIRGASTSARGATSQGTAAFREAPGLMARSWRQVDQDFLWAIQSEKGIMTLIMLFVIVVAAFLTMSLLLVLVLKKTREIGLLVALGATRLQVALCFCLQGVLIGIAGAGFGVGLGFLVLAYRNGLVQLAIRLTGGGPDALGAIYSFSELPAHTETRDLVLIVSSAIVMSTLAGIIPAFVAARLKPVEALRNE